ncbi:MAG: hypothetical protein WC119_00230 [Synergistaceae bacterium]
MTDRIKGLTVTIENMREDDAENIINAVRMIKGVVDVNAHVADMDHYMAVETVRHQMRMQILDIIIRPNDDSGKKTV